MAVDDALRVAGGAGSIVERDGLPFVGRTLPGEIGFLFVEQFVIAELADPFAAPWRSTMSTTRGRPSSILSARSATSENSGSTMRALASPCL